MCGIHHSLSSETVRLVVLHILKVIPEHSEKRGDVITLIYSAPALDSSDAVTDGVSVLWFSYIPCIIWRRTALLSRQLSQQSLQCAAL